MTPQLVRAALRQLQCARSFKIYTKTGDGGTSSLFTGERRLKSDDIFHALGDIDELNSYLGVANESLKRSAAEDDKFKSMAETLVKTQSVLLDVGSCVATPVDSATDKQAARTAFNAELIDELEHGIDSMTLELPPLRNFILPGGGYAAAHLHVCRSVCRRAERSLGPLMAAGELEVTVGKYVNRLSDYLFTAARFASHVEGEVEVTYKKPRNKKTD